MTILSARFIPLRDLYGRETTDQYVAAYDDLGRVLCFHKDSLDDDWVRFLNQPNSIDPYLETPKDPSEPVLTSIKPSKAFTGDPDFTLQVIGENFTAGSKIVWNGGEERTVFKSPTLLTTGVKPSTASGPITIGVFVRTGAAETRSLNFTFM